MSAERPRFPLWFADGDGRVNADLVKAVLVARSLHTSDREALAACGIESGDHHWVGRMRGIDEPRFSADEVALARTFLRRWAEAREAGGRPRRGLVVGSGPARRLAAEIDRLDLGALA